MASKKVTLRVFGMTCDDCVRTVSQGLKEAGAWEISVSLKDGTASALVDENKIKPDDLSRIPVFGEKSHYKAQVRKVE
ncbi:heavy-metal-associated domain-containing protein [Oxyplasma meridianum]|uniref:Heavy-metal-associated domain-containing protein n=1 Tax=Oxyplasma meridianum TaxID=3073602 RepID=A0AAX4NIZ2_9ARCH